MLYINFKRKQGRIPEKNIHLFNFAVYKYSDNCSLRTSHGPFITKTLGTSLYPTDLLKLKLCIKFILIILGNKRDSLKYP